MHVLVIGDSIVHGGCDDEFGGWVARLKVRSMRENRGDHVFGLGLGGNNTRNLLERADAEINARKGHMRNVIFGAGTNDMNAGIPLEEFRTNLEKLGKIAAGYGKKVYFMGLFLYTSRPAGKNTPYYDAMIREVCENGGYTYIPTSDVINADDLADGCHPNAAGHAKLCGRVAEFMKD